MKERKSGVFDLLLTSATFRALGVAARSAAGSAGCLFMIAEGPGAVLVKAVEVDAETSTSAGTEAEVHAAEDEESVRPLVLQLIEVVLVDVVVVVDG